jgi:hypothetical protein
MMRLRVLFLAFGVLASCGREPERALKVTVTITDRRVRADCIKLAVLDSSAELKSVVISRPMDDQLVFGVRQGSDLPRAVRLQVQGLLGNCADLDSLRLNAQADPRPAEFPESGVQPVDLTLEPPGPALDADSDGFVAVEKGGVDCRDSGPGAAQVFPGAGQSCDVYEDTDCDGARGCDDTKCNASPFCANPGDRFTVSATPAITEMLRHECVGPFTVTLENAQGPRASVRNLQVALSASLAGTSVHAVSGCGDAPVSTYALAYGQTSFQVYLRADGTALGETTLRAAAQTVATPGSATVLVRPQPISQLRFGAPLTGVTAGACSSEQVTLEFVDSQGRPTVVESVASIALSTNPSLPSPLFYSDPACTLSVSTAGVSPGQGVVRLHVSSERAGAITMSASPSTGQAAATQVLQVAPAAPHALAFANQPLAVVSTQNCSTGALEVELRDRFGNTITPASDVVVDLSSSLGDLSFRPVSDTTCAGAAVTSVTIAAGASSARARVRPGAAGSGTVTARSSTLTVTEATQVIDVAGGQPGQIMLAGSAQSPLAGECSGAPLELRVLDANGNPSSFLTDVTVSLSTMPTLGGTFGFFTRAGCAGTGAMSVTVPSGQSRVLLYFRGTQVSTFTIRASISMPINLTTAPPELHSIRPNVPGRLVFLAPAAQSTIANVCSGNFNMELQDVHGNPTSFMTETPMFVDGGVGRPGVFSAGTGAGCDIAPVFAANASTSFFGARQTIAGTYQLTATVGSLTTTTSVQLSVDAGIGNLLVDVPDGGMADVVAGTCRTVTLSRRDTFGNNAVLAGMNPVTFSLPTGTTLYPGTTTCVPGASTTGSVPSLTMSNTHTITFQLKPTAATSQTISATVAGQTAQVVLNVLPGAPTLRFETPANGTATQTAGGCTEVRVARRDAFNNLVPLGSPQSVTFAGLADPGQETTFHTSSSCDATSAVTSIPLGATDAQATFWVRARKAGMQTPTISLGGENVNMSLTVNPDAASVQLRIEEPAGGTANVVAGTCREVRVARRDQFDNLVPLASNQNLSFTSSEMLAFNNSTCTTGTQVTQIAMNAGTSLQTFRVQATQAGLRTLQATLTGQSVNLSLQVAPGPTQNFLITGLPPASPGLVAGDCSATSLTVTRRDQYNNLITEAPDLTVNLRSAQLSFSTSPTCDVVAATTTVTIAQGQSASASPVYVRGTTVTLANGAVVTADVVMGMAPQGTASTTITPGPPHRLAIVGPATRAGAVDACASGAEVELQDEFGNSTTPGGNVTVDLAASGNTVTFFRQAGCSSPNTTLQLSNTTPRVPLSFRYVGPAPTTLTITASTTSSPVQSAQASWSMVAGPGATLVWLDEPAAEFTRFSCVAAGRVGVVDVASNPTTFSAANTVTLAASRTSAGFSLSADPSCSAVVPSVVVTQGSSQTPQLFGIATGSSGAFNLTPTSGTPPPAAGGAKAVAVTGGEGTFAITAAGGNVDLEAGDCRALTVQRRSSDSLPVTFGVTPVNVTLPNGTTALTLHAAAGCADAGGLSVPVTIAHGQSQATVFVRGRSTSAASTQVAVTATDANNSSMTGALTLTAYPLVRRGSCDLTNTNSSCRATLTPFPAHRSIARSFVIFTSTGSPTTSGPVALSPEDQNVECHLETGTEVEVVCTRIGTNGLMSVNYQVASFGDAMGVSVQHRTGNTSGASATTNVGISAVTTSESFVLFSAHMSGAVNGGDAFPTAFLQANNNVRINSVNAVARAYSVQVVSMTGAAVQAVTSGGSAQTGQTITLPIGSALNATTLARSFVLATARVDTNNTNENFICKRRFRVTLSATEVTARRGGGANHNDCVSDGAVFNSQVVTLPAWASVTSVAMSTNGRNTTFTSSTFTAVAKDRALILLGMQGPGGQTAGETAFRASSAADDNTGHVHALADFNGPGDRVSLTRIDPGTNTDAQFNPFVLRFNP